MIYTGAAAVDEVVVPVQNQSEQRSEQGGQNGETRVTLDLFQLCAS